MCALCSGVKVFNMKHTLTLTFYTHTYIFKYPIMLVELSVVIFPYLVAKLEEDKKSAQIERESLIANYQQHLQLEKEQQESKRKVRICIGEVFVFI